MMRTTLFKTVTAVPMAILFFWGVLLLPSMAVAVQAQAVISADEAEQAALSAILGTVVEHAQLEDENGLQVYSVIIEADDGSGKWDVKVDAATRDA